MMSPVFCHPLSYWFLLKMGMYAGGRALAMMQPGEHGADHGQALVFRIGSAVAAPHNGSEEPSIALTTTPPRSVDRLVDVPYASLSLAFPP